jgi:hypothetical protein
MNRLRVLALLLVPLLVAAKWPDLSVEQSERLKCVATFAIIANEQQRGVPEWTDFPDLTDRGGLYSDSVIQRIAGDLRIQRALVEQEVVQHISEIQRQSSSEEGSTRVLHTLGESCLADLESVVPEAPAPGLTRCAALLALARDDARAREGMTKAVKDLTVFASVLENRARTSLRSDGRTEAESDIILGTERETLSRAFQEGKASGSDFPACFDLAKP